ncbi:uncharacterized protein LOC144904194 [Branchiostoma floridae x Branchiostoma belcheri]
MRGSKEAGVPPKVNRKKGFSQKWWRAFKGRNKLTLRKPSPLDRGRRDSVDGDVVKQFFTLLKSTLSDNGLSDQPHRVYNVDETGFDLDPQKKSVVTFSKMGAPAVSVRKGTRDHISTMECVSADGSVLPPLVIFSKSYPSSAYRLEGPDNAVYSTTPSGFIEAEVFVEWLKKCFCRFSSPERPVLLLMDQHSSHLTANAIDTAVANDVILMGLPPHTSHFLQPLDAQGGPFSKMKSTFEDVVNEMRLVRPNFFMTKSVFPKVYRVVREKSLSMSVIKTGFEKTGVFPVNESKVDSRWLTLNSQPESHDDDNEEAGAEDVDEEEPVNPFVKAGIVPAYVADLLTPIQDTSQRRVRRVRPRAIVFDEKYVDDLRKEAEEKEERKVKEQMKRKEEREEKKRKKIEEMERKRQERLQKKRQQRKEIEDIERKRKERLQKKRQQRKEIEEMEPTAGTSASSVGPEGQSEDSEVSRPRRAAKRPLWMIDFTTEDDD